MISYRASNTILYPLMLFVRRSRTGAGHNDQHVSLDDVDVDVDKGTLRTSFEMNESTNTASVDVHLVTMTSIPESTSIGIILHRTDLDSCFVFDHRDYPLSEAAVSAIHVTQYDYIRITYLPRNYSFVRSFDRSID